VADDVELAVLLEDALVVLADDAAPSVSVATFCDAYNH
jgi:hypothetical protein